MKIKTLGFTSLALAALLALPAAAVTGDGGDRYGYQTSSSQRYGSYSSNLVPCDMLIDEDVNTSDGKQVGELEALVLHPQGNQVAYCVVSKGEGFLGFGSEDHFAVPWTAFQFNRTGPDDFDCVLNISGEQLDNAVEVGDPDDNVGNEQFIRDVYAAFGPQYRDDYEQLFGSGSTMQPQHGQQQYQQPSWGGSQMSYGNLSKEKLEVTNLIGTEVVKSNQDEFGTIDDLACDAQTGQIAYAIIGLGSTLQSELGLNQEFVAVPWMALQPKQDQFTLNVDEQNLNALAIDYNDQDIQELENQSFAMNIHQTLGVQPYWEMQAQTGGRSMPYQERYTWDTQGRTSRQWQQRPGDRYTYDQPPQTGRETWQQDQQMGRNTWDLDNRRMSYRGQMSPGMERGLAQGQPVTVEGTVQHMYTHTAGGMDELVLHLMTNNGESMFVQAGPNWFAKQKNVDFSKGDRVSVTGHLISNPGQSQTVVARTIETQDQTYTVRDRQLRPEWARR